MKPDEFFPCPLCKTNSPLFFSHTHSCPHCNLIFKSPKIFLSNEAESARYRTHQNVENDPGYINFLNRLAIPLKKYLKKSDHQLDYGCGPFSQLSKNLEAFVASNTVYDPLFFPDNKVIEKQYEVVTCTEVVEHFKDAERDWEKLLAVVKPQGILGIMTQFYPDQHTYKDWWYKNDPTHVDFYHEKTLTFLAKKYQLNILYNDHHSVAIFKKKLNSAEIFPKETYCYTCYRMQKNCLCHLMKPFDSKIQFVILIHPMEAKKEKLGTARITKAIIKNTKLIMGIDFTNDSEVNAMILDANNKCFVLYPGESAVNVSSSDVSPLKEDKNIIIFVIDGTWPCAKKMMKLSINLQHLPRVSFTNTNPSRFEIKEQPADFCLSTLESIHFFLSECERRGLMELHHAHQNLLDVFQAMIDFQIKCASDPNVPTYRKGARGYSKKSERVKSKKWEKRKIVLY